MAIIEAAETGRETPRRASGGRGMSNLSDVARALLEPEPIVDDRFSDNESLPTFLDDEYDGDVEEEFGEGAGDQFARAVVDEFGEGAEDDSAGVVEDELVESAEDDFGAAMEDELDESLEADFPEGVDDELGDGDDDDRPGHPPLLTAAEGVRPHIGGAPAQVDGTVSRVDRLRTSIDPAAQPGDAAQAGTDAAPTPSTAREPQPSPSRPTGARMTPGQAATGDPSMVRPSPTEAERPAPSRVARVTERQAAARLESPRGATVEPASVEPAPVRSLPGKFGAKPARSKADRQSGGRSTAEELRPASAEAVAEEIEEIVELESGAGSAALEAGLDGRQAADQLDWLGEDAQAQSRSGTAAGAGYTPRLHYSSGQYAYEYEISESYSDEYDDPQYDDDEDEEEGAYALDSGHSAIEAPRRRGWYHHSSDEDHHGRRRRQRRSERDYAFRRATIAISSLAGLALLIMLLLTVASIAATAVIEKETQAPPQSNPRTAPHRGKPRHIPIPVPAPKTNPKANPPVGVPPIFVPVPPPVAVPPVVPPEVPPPAVPPSHGKPPARRTGPTGPPGRRREPSRPPGRPKGPTRPPSKKPLPMCKNVKVYIGDGVSLPIEQVEKSLDPAELGIPGVCVPDNGNGPTGLTSLVRLRGQKSASSGGTSTQAAPQLDDDAATPIAAATTASVSTTAPATTTASASSGLLTSDQELFGARLVADTGLDPQVVAAWMYAEENGSAAQDRQASDNNDWLNIGFTGPATFGGGDSIWSSPITAADATAGWMAGRATVPGYDPTKDESILAILGTAGQPPLAQLSAIEKSDWASSHYNFDLVNVYLLLTGVKLPSVAGGTLTATGSGGTLTLAELTSEMPTITQAELSHVTTQDLENAVPQLEAALGVTSAQTTSELLPAGSGPAGAQRMLAAAQAVIGATYNQGNHDDVSESEATVRQLGTDCSGFVSWLIGPNGAGLWSQTYTTVTMSQAPNLEPGTGTAGHYVTIYNNPLPGNAGHVFIDIEGRWFEDAGGIGVHQMDASEVQSYLESGQYTQIFHPVGM